MTSKSLRIPMSVVLLLTGVLLGGFFGGYFWTAEAQSAPTTTSNLPRTITVVGEGSVNIEPDVARTTIGVEVTGDNVKDASDEADATLQAVLAALADLGVAQRDIQTAGYSIYQDRTPVGPQGELSQEVVYRVSNNVAVTIRDLDSVGDVLDAAIEAGANSIYGVDFSVDDPNAVMAEARREAAEDARARADELAALHGVAVGELVSISEVIGGFGPPTMMENIASFGGGKGISPGELKLSARLQVVYAIAPAGAARAPVVTPIAQAPLPVVTVQVATVAPPVTTPTPAASSRTGNEPSVVPEVTKVVSREVVVQQVVVPVPPGSGEPGQLTIVGGDEQALRRFLERWLAPSYPGAAEKQEARLLLGQLPAPDELPFDVPLPENATVVASLLQGYPMGTQIILDAEQPVDTVLDFYVQELAAQGFVTPTGSRTYGDVFSSHDFGQTLCNYDQELIVQVTAYDVADGPTDVRLSINPTRDYNTPCNPEPEMPGGPMNMLPSLQQPPGVQRTQGGAGTSGNDGAYASAELETDLSVAELAQHYMAQLQAAGWQLVDESQTEAVAWSVWTFDDEDGDAWGGTLLITDRPAVPDGRFALLRVEKTK